MKISIFKSLGKISFLKMPLCLVAEKEEKQTGGVMKLLREPSQCKNLIKKKPRKQKQEKLNYPTVPRRLFIPALQ